MVKVTHFIKLFILFSLFLISFAHAEDGRSVLSFELIGGGLTYHMAGDASPYYTDKVSSDGRLIDNFIYGAGVNYIDSTGLYISIRYFKGNNSVHLPINGGTFSAGAAYKYLDVGWIIGGYVQNEYDFIATGIIPFSLNHGSNSVVPIIGVEISPKLPLGNSFYLKLNNILTPLLTNHTISLGLNF